MKNKTNLSEGRNVWSWVLGDFCYGWLGLWRLRMRKTRRARSQCFESINNEGGLNLGKLCGHVGFVSMVRMEDIERVLMRRTRDFVY